MASMAAAAIQGACCAAGSGDAAPMLQLPMRLSVVPAATQFLLDSGELSEQHVGYLAFERLVLGATGRLRQQPKDRYAPLLEFCKTMQANCGGAAVSLMHGAGDTDNPHASHSAAEYLLAHTFGTFADRTITRNQPAPPKTPGLVMADVLNIYAAAARFGHAVTYEPAGPDGAPTGVTLHMLNIGMDGMLLKSGTLVDESTLEVCGFEERLSVAEAQARRCHRSSCARVACLRAALIARHRTCMHRPTST